MKDILDKRNQLSKSENVTLEGQPYIFLDSRIARKSRYPMSYYSKYHNDRVFKFHPNLYYYKGKNYKIQPLSKGIYNLFLKSLNIYKKQKSNHTMLVNTFYPPFLEFILLYFSILVCLSFSIAISLLDAEKSPL